MCISANVLNLELASKEMVNLLPKYDLPWHIYSSISGRLMVICMGG
jgi:hypothetical protein